MEIVWRAVPLQVLNQMECVMVHKLDIDATIIFTHWKFQIAPNIAPYAMLHHATTAKVDMH